MSKFSFEENQLKVLANFASIDTQILVEPERLTVVNEAKTVIAEYKFNTPFTFDAFGLYDATSFLSILSAMKKSVIEVKDKCLHITCENDRLTYFTTAKEMIPKSRVNDAENIYNSLDIDLNFSLPSDRLAVAMKMASVLKSKYLFFETDGKRIRMTLGDELESSANTYEVYVDDGIKANKLCDPVRISLVDFKILPGEYQVGIGRKEAKGTNKYFSKWSNLNGVTYYIVTEVVK